MKKKKLVLITTAILVIIIVPFMLFIKYQNQKSETILNLTTEQKISDYETLCTLLDERYPFWKEVEQAGVSKEAIYETYRSNIEKTKTDIDYFKEINYFLKEFQGIGHLSVLDGYSYRMYMDTIRTSEGMLTDEERQEIQSIIETLTNSTSQETYDLLDQSHSGFRSTIGLKEEYRSDEPAKEVEEEERITTHTLKGKKAVYLKIPSFELTNYEWDKKELANFWIEIQNIPNLIIDLRGNSGGSDLYWEDLLVEPNAKEQLVSERYFLFRENGVDKQIKDITTFEKAENPYQGKIWVLVDEDVYSASENFVIFCKNTGFATLVGTNTGGDGGYADPMLFDLPNSGLIVRFSIFYGLNADGTGNEANGTTPDIIVTEEEWEEINGIILSNL